MIIGDGKSEFVIEERNDRNKSSYVWFTDEYYFTVTPLAYDLATLDGQFVLPDGSSYRLDDLDEVSYDEMTDYFDGIIEVDGDTMLGVKRNDDDTVNVSKIES